MISLLDSCVVHDPSRFSECDRNNLNHDKILLTDNFVSYEVKNKYKFSWLIEPQTYITKEYNYLLNNNKKFDKIFTHSKTILDNCDNSIFIPFGTTFLSDDEYKIYNKTKLISMVSSNKNFLPGHTFRLKIIEKFRSDPTLDIFGRGFNEIDKKCSGLSNYYYSVAIENSKYDFWFTEKLIDCFLTGTIPIYYGCPSISKFFNVDGIYQIDNMLELDEAISKISVNDYYSRIDAIKDNFQRSLEYLDPYKKVYSIIKDYL